MFFGIKFEYGLLVRYIELKPFDANEIEKWSDINGFEENDLRNDIIMMQERKIASPVCDTAHAYQSIPKSFVLVLFCVP